VTVIILILAHIKQYQIRATSKTQNLASPTNKSNLHESLSDTLSNDDMETGKPPPKLLQHADRILPQAVHPHLIACCPTMDLIAVVNHEEQLNVYRFGGQRAFGLQKKGGQGKIVSLGWKFNGG
jgi:hypothetical protein